MESRRYRRVHGRLLEVAGADLYLRRRGSHRIAADLLVRPASEGAERLGKIGEVSHLGRPGHRTAGLRHRRWAARFWPRSVDRQSALSWNPEIVAHHRRADAGGVS